MEQDAIIIGSGPAGISAALYLLRAGFQVSVLSRDNGALGKAHLIENYYGLPENISGDQLAENGRRQLLRLGGALLEQEVTSINWDGSFHVHAAEQELAAPVLILAAGIARNTRSIPGLRELEGKGVSYCATCDSFFYRGKDLCVLGSGAYALSELEELLPLAGHVTLLTNGEPLSITPPDSITVEHRAVKALLGMEEGQLRAVQLEDGSELACSGLFVALGTADGSAIARQLGLMLKDGLVPVERDMSTAVPGLFAAGDCVSPVKQIAVAVGQGALAGLSAIQYLRKQQKKK